MVTLKRQTIVLAAAVISTAALAFVALAFGPKTRHTSLCQFCGRGRWEVWRLGIKVSDRITQYDWSTWVDSFHPDHTQHIWSVTSTQQRPWFGAASMGDGGVAGVAGIYAARDRIGDAEARKLLARYHVAIESDRQAARAFLFNQVEPLLTNTSEKTAARQPSSGSETQ